MSETRLLRLIIEELKKHVDEQNAALDARLDALEACDRFLCDVDDATVGLSRRLDVLEGLDQDAMLLSRRDTLDEGLRHLRSTLRKRILKRYYPDERG